MLESQKKEQQQLLLQIKRIVASPAISVKNAKIAKELYKEIKEQLPALYLIASGGVGSLQDIEHLAEAGVPAVIFGKAIYEGRIALKDLARFAE